VVLLQEMEKVIYVFALIVLCFLGFCQANVSPREERFFSVSLGRLCQMDKFYSDNEEFCTGFSTECPDPAVIECCKRRYLGLEPSQKETLIKTTPPKDKSSYMNLFEAWSMENRLG
jgi:hypothetical protein